MEVRKQSTTASLLFRNLIFTILQPGLVAGVIPYFISGEINTSEMLSKGYQYAGLIVSVIGFFIMIRCIIQFALEGKGTLSPADPTKRLVIRGLYRFSRNPMYVGVMLILIGETIITQSVSLLIYLAIVFIAFNLFVYFREEPRLRSEFGESYTAYCRQVRRWI